MYPLRTFLLGRLFGRYSKTYNVRVTNCVMTLRNKFVLQVCFYIFYSQKEEEGNDLSPKYLKTTKFQQKVVGIEMRWSEPGQWLALLQSRPGHTTPAHRNRLLC